MTGFTGTDTNGLLCALSIFGMQDEKGKTMVDLISRQWLMECVEEGWIKFDTEKDTNIYIHLIRDIAPSTDAVEVVRCKDCKHSKYAEPGMVYCPLAVGGWVEEDWFCKGGERKDKQHTD